MNFCRGDKMIQEVLNKYPKNSKKRQGMIDFILWSVAKGDDSSSVELANALIWKYDLFFSKNGSHNWFECDKTAGSFVPNRFPADHIFDDVNDVRYVSLNTKKILKYLSK